MMPKGVEHWLASRPFFTPILVRIPMMPKGVEHTRNVAAEILDLV